MTRKLFLNNSLSFLFKIHYEVEISVLFYILSTVAFFKLQLCYELYSALCLHRSIIHCIIVDNKLKEHNRRYLIIYAYRGRI